MGNVEFFLRDVVSPFIRQVEMDLFPFIIQPRPERLPGLCPLIRNTVYLFSDRETGSRLDKIKRNVVFSALVT